MHYFAKTVFFLFHFKAEIAINVLYFHKNINSHSNYISPIYSYYYKTTKLIHLMVAPDRFCCISYKDHRKLNSYVIMAIIT